ncbi:MAG TPA: hypothetical protein VLS47_00180 [Gallionella sp.]|nr:hypothetical protein [Gallionella sp.]
MKSVHLVIPDLFLPKDIAAEVCADLRLPALEKLLGRGVSTKASALRGVAGSGPSTAPARGTPKVGNLLSSKLDAELTPPVGAPPLSGDPVAGSGRAGEGGCLENHLCELFGVPCAAEAPVAPISAAFDGLAAGCWLRADPVHLRLQRDQMLLLPNREISADEAGQLCASLNLHFAGQGMEFFAPHPQRWYVRLDTLPRIHTRHLSQVIGADVRGALPTGADAARWHQVFNEVQMLLFAHPLNEARDERGALTVNSLWFWGGGCAVPPMDKDFDCISSDEVLAEMFAAASGISFSGWPKQWRDEVDQGRQLLVWTGLRSALHGGDLAAWRAALQDFESGYARPLWQALRTGKIARLQLDILSRDSNRRVTLTRGDAWSFWRRAGRLAGYSSR